MRTLLFLAALFMSSCFRDIHTLKLKENITKKETFSILLVEGGCCGCKTVYYNLISEKRIKEQIIYEYECQIGLPTKFIFHYNSQNKIVALDTLMAVYDGPFTVPLSHFEKNVLLKMDSIMRINTLYSIKLALSKITGFRRLRTGESASLIPYNKKKDPIFSLN